MREKRTDWLMRQFCTDISDAMFFGMSLTEAQRRMTDRGVPYHVQWRLIDR